MKHFVKTAAVVMAMWCLPAFAAQALSGDVHVRINGLVCDFCARALEKVFAKQDAVAAIAIDLDTKIVTIDFHDGKFLDDAAITRLIVDAGYSVEGIHHVEK